MNKEQIIEEAARAAYNKGFMRHAPLDAPRWVDISDEARESWRVIARTVMNEIDAIRDDEGSSHE